MSEITTRIASSLAAARAITDFQPEIAIILGSGLGPLAEDIDSQTGAVISYADLPGFPVSTAPGHAGKAVLGKLEGKRVIAFQGRVHLYEGYNAKEVVLPVSLAHAMGAKTLFVSNACGGLNPAWEAGDIMLQNDFINFTGTNPLLGPNDSSLGPRFLPLMGGYDKDLSSIAREAARACDLALREGVYLGITGPMYAPRAELRMYRQWGADTVGMSTVLEVIQALYLGMRVLGLSSVTDMAIADREDHSETNEQAVIEQAQKTGPNFRKLVKSILRRMG